MTAACFTGPPFPFPGGSRALSVAQWVRTEYQGQTVTGRIVGTVPGPGNQALYEVELPLLTGSGGMVRIIRPAHELVPAG